jgi:cytochrome b subunit of formate dehydrogenase
METLKKVVTNEYFAAAAVLSGVVLFWVLGLFGGLSLLSTRQTPVTTLTWLLFVYAVAVLSPLAGLVAAIDLVRRWLRNRQIHAAESV